MQLRSSAFSVALGLAMMFASNAALAQYHVTRLDSNQVRQAANTDPLIVNAWGLVHGPGTPWWVSDNGSGWSTLYKSDGTQVSTLKVLIPTAGENGPGSPTGVVFNGSQDFQIQGSAASPAAPLFIFSTLDGTISAWSPKVDFNSSVAAPLKNAPKDASYTGLAITSNTSGNFLFAADMANGQVDIYDATYTFKGAFTDSTLPAGFVPFGVRDINGIVYVTFAAADGSGGGFVELFKEDGTPVNPGKPLIHGEPLNQPWGIAIAPAGFGPFSNTILISNNTDRGTINAFNPNTGNFVGTLRHRDGRKIVIDQLWAIDFGDGKGANGPPNQLFYTAGPANNLAGEFGTIVFQPGDDD
jgi:uncharacterized protein (TIGR03118 family)